MVGKTSLFTILTGVTQETRMGSTAVRTGVAKVPDPRVDALAELYQPPKITYATVEYIDAPAISKETLRDPAYLASLRVVDAFAQVLRIFQDETVPHEHGSVDPARDFDDVETELILSDLVVVEKRLDRVDRDRKKTRNPELDKEYELLIRCKEALEANTPLRNLEFEGQDEKGIRGFQFLSQKPMLLVLNLGEEDATRLHEVEEQYRTGSLSGKANTAVAAVCGKIEAELAELDDAAAAELLTAYGLKQPGLHRLIRATYDLMGLISFFTAGEPEVRAWTIRRGTPAVKAAGAIHTDIERNFIRAEVVRCEDLLAAGSWPAAREKGQVRLEGKEYIVQEGDVVLFRHSG